jgi:ATP-dependent exoDNAse (exonuclease V) beta subunit
VETLFLHICLSGIWKTYALVKEYLKIILVAPKMMPIATFSAITFTKAVHEMKSRIVGKFSEFAKTNQVQKHGQDAGFIH